MRECFANLERNDGFGGDSSPSQDDPCRRALRPIDRPRPLSATSAKRRYETSPHVSNAQIADVRSEPKHTATTPVEPADAACHRPYAGEEPRAAMALNRGKGSADESSGPADSSFPHQQIS
jgi:hypothetical protein